MWVLFCAKVNNLINGLSNTITKWLTSDYIVMCKECGTNMIISYPVTTCATCAARRCVSRIIIESPPVHLQKNVRHHCHY